MFTSSKSTFKLSTLVEDETYMGGIPGVLFIYRGRMNHSLIRFNRKMSMKAINPYIITIISHIACRYQEVPL